MIVFRATLGANYNPTIFQEYYTHADTNRQIYVGPYVNSPVYGQLNFTDNTIVYTGIIDDQSQVGFTQYGNRNLQANDGGFYWDVSGNTGPATLVGGNFGDILRTGSGNDSLNGGDGNDVLEGGAGGDAFDGGAGTDTVSFEHSNSNVRIYLDPAGANLRTGDAFGDTYTSIENIRGSDVVGGGLQDDVLVGDGNANVIEGGAGADYINGGGGADTASYEHSGAGVSVNLSTGTATGGDAQGDVNFNAIVGLRGSANADSLTGDGIANVLDGLAGADTLTGMNGSDTYFVDNVNDVVIEGTTGDAGTADTVFAFASYTLGAGQGIEVLRERGTVGATLTGNELANSVYGNVGNDTISGGSGQDQLIGGTGADTFVFKFVTDSNAAARDTIRDFSQAQGDTIDLSQIQTDAADHHFFLASGTSFHKQAGELIVTHNAGSTQVQGDVDGNGKADLLIVVGGNIALTASDFDLA